MAMYEMISDYFSNPIDYLKSFWNPVPLDTKTEQACDKKCDKCIKRSIKTTEQMRLELFLMCNIDQAALDDIVADTLNAIFNYGSAIYKTPFNFHKFNMLVNDETGEEMVTHKSYGQMYFEDVDKAYEFYKTYLKEHLTKDEFVEQLVQNNELKLINGSMQRFPTDNNIVCNLSFENEFDPHMLNVTSNQDQCISIIVKSIWDDLVNISKYAEHSDLYIHFDPISPPIF